jgi:2-oxoglutarate dehydrogenase complex dehydrogenase (E1) component-like enzyme
MYHQIRKNQKPLPVAYCEKLVLDKLVKPDAYNSIRAKVFKHLDEEYEKAKVQKQTLEKVTNPKTKGSKAFTHKWEGMKFSEKCETSAQTGLDVEHLK